MERLLVKSGVYGFIIGLFIAIWICPDTIRNPSFGGGYSIEAVPMRDYILTVLRFAIKLSLGTVAAVWLYNRFWKTPADGGEPSFWYGFFKAFFIVLGIIIAITLVATAIGSRH
ncbi:hypothetical protein [Paenibacillus piri]|uniref:Uncharacterized protein n=1 Tax=Paenibacillus piri TaxID=2547395 RepID=A0A4V2ZSU7_9BACL|nr:hypothetical protein [Paenibacillus piri]TDF94514.1 hypothetical protein E1757_24255 [Paenibacillus piri]